MSTSRVVIVTGASRGIGLAACKHLLSHGHSIAAIARSTSALDELKSSAKDPTQVLPLTEDLSDLTAGPRIVEATLQNFKRIDAIVINHGTLDPIKRIADLSAEEWRSAFDINVFSGISLIQAAIPHLRTQPSSTIILTSSGASVTPYSTWGAYGAAKAVFNHLALTLSVEEPRITTISLRPGVVDTEMQRDIREKHAQFMDEKDREKFLGLKPQGKLLRPEQPGHVIARLAVGAGRELSGKFVNWNDEVLGEFQEKE